MGNGAERPAPLKARRKRGKAAAASSLKPPTQAEVMEVAFGLAKELSLELREEELVGTFAQAIRRLLPGRLLCLRVVDPRTLALTSMIADGRVSHGLLDEHAALAIKRSALRRTRLREAITASGQVRVMDGYTPVFSGSVGGFSVPLVASGELFGLLNVEYPPSPDDQVSLAAVDEQVVIVLANQLSVALRNLHLLGQARYYRDYLRQMIDVANALIVVIDRDKNIAVMNTAMQRYCNFSPEVIGRSLDEVKRRSKAAEPRLGSLLSDGLNGREYTDAEVNLGRGDGSVGRAVFNTSVLRAQDGSIDGVIAIGQDRERVRSLERQVIQAEKLATLGQLAAGVVHELNNPLTSISVYGEYILRLLEKKGASQPDLEKAKKIVEGATRIQKLTRDLTNYARPSGEFEAVELNEVVREAIDFCEHVLRRADALLELRLVGGLPRVPAIRAQLHQVLINLVTNACHALPAPGERVVLSTSLADDGKHVMLSVSDTGVGIDALDQARVFEPFFTTKKEGRGTGLGLSIVKNIVERHGGHISFESQVGQGTSFFITLPVDKEPESK